MAIASIYTLIKCRHEILKVQKFSKFATGCKYNCVHACVHITKGT